MYAVSADTPLDVVSATVEEVYDSGLVYDGGQHYTYPGKFQFHVSDLLSDLESGGADYADCRDFANWLHVLTGSVGVYAQYRVLDRTTSPYYFTTNYILAAQGSWTTCDWNFHQVGWWSSKVADASLQVDNDADAASPPHTPKLSKGDMTQSEYIDKLTETPDVTDVERGTCTVQ